MLIFKFCKNNGFEFVSHLDTLKHIRKTILRAKIPMEYSKGFNPHMLIFSSQPVFLGLESEAEYCLAETNISAELFKDSFNRFSPKGIKCVDAFNVTKRHNLASLIDNAEYRIVGINTFDVNEILNSESFLIIDKHGEQKEVRSEIKALKFEDDVLIARLAFGGIMLRVDVFSESLAKIYGGEPEYKKTEALIGDKTPKEIFN